MVHIMAIRPRKENKTTLLPPDLRMFIYKRGQESVGIFLFLCGLSILLCLLTYDRSDPSLNTAVDGPIHNLGGMYGAILADFLIQLIGLASFAIVIILWAWSWLKLNHRLIGNVTRKLLITPLSLISFSILCASLPQFNLWQLTTSTGGTLGYALIRKVQGWLFLFESSLGLVVLAGCSLAVAITLFLYILGLNLHEWGILWRHFAKVLQGFLRFSLKVLKTIFAQKLVKKSSRLHQKLEPVLHNTPSFSPSPSFSAPLINSPVATVLTSEEGDDDEDLEEGRVATLDLNLIDNYQLPPLNLLNSTASNLENVPIDEKLLAQKAQQLKEVLEDFGIRGEITEINPGPVVTLYELVPAPGIKSSRVIGLADDIARSMSAISARVAVIPGRNAIGIELPNESRQTVYLHDLLSSTAYERSGASLSLTLGKDIAGLPIIADLTRMPHLLVAGTTGSGKSVGINSMILSLIYRLPPDRCKMIMIDPKMLELSVYDGIPHLLAPVVTDPKKAVIALKWTVREMENRYRAMSKLGVRNIHGYNIRVSEAKSKGETLNRQVQTGFDPVSGKPIYETQPLDLELLPYIVVIVDEMADLMLVAGKEIESTVQRLAQMARAAGIHIIMATQRPSVDVITGTIKANFPTRISFQVTSKIDSRTILSEQGAEQLLGQGDMLYMAAGGRITRVHGPFVSDQEVENVVHFLKSQSSPSYIEEVTEDIEGIFEETVAGNSSNDLYDQAIALVCRERKASTSFIQRHLQIGYNRAAKLMDQMEAEGLVSSANHVGKREILMRATGSD
ncbi:MAG: DNA translocase FtsK 4TM domain-containing protein [Alphaproteobacteria bacterium]|nr:DNA translocase FtsK 4TM domain-containing protein [Alphaproteobacteria bacterium]